ncbi:hypothetical protein [Helicobacter suis]|uniref:hypothetical protein n=1 Tax=Helicobacter suis TaxID=104628 RepID=UPI0024934952|nr:hypothetical protein [Helicobacter suis]
MAYLNLVEPTLKSPDIKLIFKDPPKQEYIKAFKAENQEDLTYLLVTLDNDRLLVTGIVDAKKGYVKRQVKDADTIHPFIPPNNQRDRAPPSGLRDDSITPRLKGQEPNNYIDAEVIEHPKQLPLKAIDRFIKRLRLKV